MSDLTQVPFRLDPDVLERLNNYAKQRGMDRTSVIRMAINQLLDGTQNAPEPSPGIDQSARDALTKLAAKIKILGAIQIKHQERLNALEESKAQAVPFEIDL